MGFILVAKGARWPVIWTQLTFGAVQIALIWCLVGKFGLTGTGMAFFGVYLFFTGLIYGVVRSVSGFRWSRDNMRIGVVYALAVAATFGGWYVLPRWLAIAGGLAVTALVGVWSLRTLYALLPMDRLPLAVRKLAGLLGVAPRGEEGAA
jgi:PST family polysaccharide transporter